MGYCYDSKNRLCCDVCGTAGGVRKIKCPVGYCQSIATCQSATCKAKVKALDHSDCHKQVARHKAELAVITEGRASLLLYTETSGTHTFWRPREYAHYSACCDVFRKTWLDAPDIETLRAMGNTIAFEATPVATTEVV